MNSELKRPPARGSKGAADQRLRFAPVVVNGLPPLRGEFLVDFALLDELIVLIGIALEDVPAKDVTKDTILSKYVCAHTFTPDLSNCRNTALAFRVNQYKPSHARLHREGDRLFLNTYATRSPWEVFQDVERFDDDVLAKIVEITERGPSLIGPAPFPEVEAYFGQRHYTCGDLVLRMASDFILECRSAASDVALWRLKLSAYLYTAIEFRNGRAYFGTAGKGGRFCCVRIEDGAMLYDIATGGTISYEWVGERIVLLDIKKRDVVVVDAASGCETDRFNLGRGRSMREDAPTLVHDGCFYTVVFAQAGGDAQQQAVRVDLKQPGLSR